MAMMAITTSSSIRVKPLRVALLGLMTPFLYESDKYLITNWCTPSCHGTQQQSIVTNDLEGVGKHLELGSELDALAEAGLQVPAQGHADAVGAQDQPLQLVHQGRAGEGAGALAAQPAAKQAQVAEGRQGGRSRQGPRAPHAHVVVTEAKPGQAGQVRRA